MMILPPSQFTTQCQLLSSEVNSADFKFALLTVELLSLTIKHQLGGHSGKDEAGKVLGYPLRTIIF